MGEKKKILISNDDGFQAKGLMSLIGVAREFGDVWVVAPHRPRSGMSKAITVDLPIRLEMLEETAGMKMYRCTGTPVDCIKLACNQLFDAPPDLILSGINHGANSSISVHYSGTMGAVVEGCIHEVPSMGFSLCDYHPDADFSPMEPYVRKLISEALRNGLPKGTCLNVNAPKGEPRGLLVCRQGHGRWVEEFDQRKDPHQRDYYWITGYYQNMDNGSVDTDNHALAEGYISVVPIRIDLTHFEWMDNLKKWKL
ncbi:MAG TPA: 5'/3'-nucleotidase SurE [Prolixibacteraceae bacterium]|nr:5'/3'-nucleotidase SurE [Prolixibacteraceae bacterium]